MKKIECTKTKLLFALLQIENITNLVEDNEYEHYMVSHLTPIRVEIQRQLINLER